MSGGPALEVGDLVVRYGAIEAVRGVSMRVGRGETVALLGANGAGKSSTLGAISGLVSPSAGSIELDQERIDGLVPEQIVRRGIALCPEGRRVFATLSVAQNLRLGAIPFADRNRVDERRDYVLDLFPRLGERLGQPAGTLSGGEQQMLAIGRALIAGPTVLMLDEPSLGLAPVVVDQIFELIARLRADGMTMLLVEQNAGRALEVADRAYVLVHGRIRVEDSAARLLTSTDLEALYLEPDSPA